MSEGEGGKSAWSEWVRPLLLGALAAAPLEFGDLWACALRYGVYALAEAKDPSLGLLLDVISHPLPEGVLPARKPSHAVLQLSASWYDPGSRVSSDWLHNFPCECEWWEALFREFGCTRWPLHSSLVRPVLGATIDAAQLYRADG